MRVTPFLNGKITNLKVRVTVRVHPQILVDVLILPYLPLFCLWPFPVQTEMTLCPRTVLLTGIHAIMEQDTLQDLLEIYFQKIRNGGGEIIKCLYNPLGQRTLALFESVSSDGTV